jgi:transposase
MGQTRKRHYDRYTLDFKKMVVKLASNPSVKAKDIADTLGLHPVMVYRWQMEYRNGELRGNPLAERQPTKGVSVASTKKTDQDRALEKKLRDAEKRIRKLEKDLAQRDDELDLLKKAERFFVKKK